MRTLASPAGSTVSPIVQNPKKKPIPGIPMRKAAIFWRRSICPWVRRTSRMASDEAILSRLGERQARLAVNRRVPLG